MRTLFIVLATTWVWTSSASDILAQTSAPQGSPAEEMIRLILPEFLSQPHFKPIGYDKTGVHFVVLPINRTGRWPETWRTTFQTKPGREPSLYWGDMYWSHMTLFQVDCEHKRVRPVERTERHGSEVISSKLEKGLSKRWHKVKPDTPLGDLWKMTCNP